MATANDTIPDLTDSQVAFIFRDFDSNLNPTILFAFLHGRLRTLAVVYSLPNAIHRLVYLYNLRRRMEDSYVQCLICYLFNLI